MFTRLDRTTKLWLALVFAGVPLAIGILVELIFVRDYQITTDLAVPLFVIAVAQQAVRRRIKKSLTKS